MTRIQILELPEGASDERPPFALVIDQHEPQRYILDFDAPPENPWEMAAELLGARAVLYFPETVDIPANGIGLKEPLFIGDSSEAFTETARSRGEWMQHDQYKAALTDALGIDRLRDWDDILNAARGIHCERQAQRDAIQAIRQLHQPIECHGQTICAECSIIDDTGSITTRWKLHPCKTIRALTAPPEPETQPEQAEANQ